MVRKPVLFICLVSLALVVSACGGKASPAPGSSFSGAIEIGDKASSASISFNIREDGTAIKDLAVTLSELKCNGLSAGQVNDSWGNQIITISDGAFSSSIPAVGKNIVKYNLEASPADFPVIEDLERAGQIEGKFTSAKKASGTIKIFMWVVMTDRACELGTFPWSATAP